MFSIEQLLIPVSVAEPCGEDISFSAEVDAVARARQRDDPSLAQGEWTVALKEADWPLVATQCALLIQSRSKDLKLAVWLAEAAARTRGFRGLADGFGLLAGLCSRYWNCLHPLGEQGEYELRIGNLAWLLAQTPALVKLMAISEDGAVALTDFEQARQRAARAGRAEPGAWPGGLGGAAGAGPKAGAGDEGPTVAELDAQRRRNSEAFNAELLEDAEYCLTALRELEQAVDVRLGMDGPSFAAAREALQNAIDFIGLLAPAGDGGLAGTGAAGMGPDAMAGSSAWGATAWRGGAPCGQALCPACAAAGGAACGAASGGSGLAGPAGVAGRAQGGLATRAQALGQLRQIAEFFRRTEPHSPVAYLADKAAGWGEMPLHEWLRAVVKDPAQSAQLDELLGTSLRSE